MLALLRLAVTPQPKVWIEAPNDPLGLVSPKQFAGPYPLRVTGAAMDALTKGPKQAGAPAGTLPGRATIGWGRRDLVTLPRQAHRAVSAFPDAELHWFEGCGHFPQWDAPDEAARLIADDERLTPALVPLGDGLLAAVRD